DVHDGVLLGPGGVAEPALRPPAVQRHLPALEQPAREPRAGAGVLALHAEAGRLALPGADAPADAPLELSLLDAGGNAGEVHDRCALFVCPGEAARGFAGSSLQIATPRRRTTSSFVRSWSRPLMVALTRFSGFVLPWTFVRMLVMPQACSTSRTPGPAFTPVPGPAGTMITRLAPYLPPTRCGTV